MIDFHTWRCRCEEVGRDSGFGHEASHLMHDTQYSIYDCIIYMEYKIGCFMHAIACAF